MSTEIAARMRVALRDGVAHLRTLITHPMDNGLAKTPDGKLIPAHHLNLLRVKVGDRLLLNARLGSGVAKDPTFAFDLPGATAGTQVEMHCEDNQGGARTLTQRVG